jgi:hypothetical protein
MFVCHSTAARAQEMHVGQEDDRWEPRVCGDFT